MDKTTKPVKKVDDVTIRFAGDSGDGIQLTGKQFTRTTALSGNELTTFPDYPAEIRAPAGTTFGVSGFQIHFGSHPIYTPGDQVDVLVAMNPAALKVNLKYLKPGAIIIVNTDNFTERNLKLAGYESNPLEDGSLKGYQVYPVAITTLTRKALEGLDLSAKEKDRSKNFFALGIVYWLYSRPLEPTIEWIQKKFAKRPELVEANIRALKAGRNFADSTELFASHYVVEPAKIEPGIYRNITGNEALALGIIAAGKKAGLPVFYGSYPITPASDILHELAIHKNFDVKTFQAEDEIAAIGSALGASFAGNLGFTATSGPGLALKTEFLNLAVMVELPLVVIDVQRAGPSTGMPTKTEQADLLFALYGRPGESPVPVIACKTPSDCFDAVYEATRVAVKFMTPVIVLSDLYLANGAEPWKVPDPEQLPPVEVEFAKPHDDFLPYKRNPETLAREWAIPGTPQLEHRIGGLEKEDGTGNVSYDPDNHQKMVELRAGKVAKVGDFVNEPEIIGPDEGKLLVVSWGSTYGSVFTAVDELRQEGKSVAYYHLRWINPLPKKLAYYIKNFDHILVPEINTGHLARVLRDHYNVPVHQFNRIKGQPLMVHELKDEMKKLIEG